MENFIRKACPEDMGRVAEIIVFNNRLNYRKFGFEFHGEKALEEDTTEYLWHLYRNGE